MSRERVIDIAVALAAFALTLLFLVAAEEHGRDLNTLGVTLAALASLPLLFRRRAPLAVFVFISLASTALFALEHPDGPPVGPTVALYFVGVSRAQTRTSFRVTAGLVVALFVVHISSFGISQGRFPGPELALGVALWAVAWVAGDRTRLRRERVAELEERALRAEREAERERRLAAAEERTRIARDLHDSAGHAINVILVQAGAARVLRDKDPMRSRVALETIETVARETLTEIDRLVRVLRDDDDGEVAAPTGLAALESLAERHRAAGLDVSIEIDGNGGLAPAVDQAAYRIVQESLTNALLHGRGEADVSLAYGDEALEIAVTNPVAVDAARRAGGHGIVGMRERALLVGGSFEAGRDDGTFRVRARLPYSRGRA